MNVKHMLIATAVATVVMAPAAFADSGKGKGGSGGSATSGVTDTRLIAKLRPIPTSQESLFEGHVVRRTSGGGRDEFEARVEVPQDLLQGVDQEGLQPTLTLASGSCMMIFDEIDTVSGVVEYKVSIRSRNGVTVNRAGSCGPTPMLPAVNVNETATVDINGNMLQGTFAAKR